MKSLIVREFEGHEVSFDNNGWINATAVAKAYDKDLQSWLRSYETLEYIVELEAEESNSVPGTHLNKIRNLQAIGAARNVIYAEMSKLITSSNCIKTRRGSAENGGGTWINSDLNILLGRFISAKFARWCDKQVKSIMEGRTKNLELDWKRARHLAAASYKGMSQALYVVKEEQGKEAEPHHYIIESKLCNWALTGEFKGLNREDLSLDDLDVLGELELANMMWLLRGDEYKERRSKIEVLAKKLLADRTKKLV